MRQQSGWIYCLAILAVLGMTTYSQAGFNISYGEIVVLDGQTTDWITVQDGGLGKLYGGTANIGVEGLTNQGDLKMESGGQIDGNQFDEEDHQYSGTINVGSRLEMLGGDIILRNDTLNILGRMTPQAFMPLLQVYNNSSLDARYSWINVQNGTFDLYSIRTESTVNSSSVQWESQLINSAVRFGDELIVSGQLWVENDYSLGEIAIKQSGEGRGDVVVRNGGGFNLHSATMRNTTGSLNNFHIYSGGAFEAENSTIEIGGSMDVDGEYSAVTLDHSVMAIVGNLSISGGATFSIYNSTFTADSFYIESGSAFETYQSNINLNTLTLGVGSMQKASGHWNVENVYNDGMIIVGFSPAVLNLDGDYSQGSTGTLEMEIGGYNLEDNDIFNITRSATLGGVLDLKLINNFEPQINDSFTLMTYGSYSGTFDFTSPIFAGDRYFELEYNDTSLKAIVVPEPVTWFLILSGFTGIIKRRS